MPIFSIEIIKTIDERKLQETTKEKQTKTKRSEGNRSYSERVKTKWFYCAFKLGFLQLICRELYKSKDVAVEWKCLKIWDLLLFLICSSILVLKWRQVSPIQLELQLAQVNLYTRKDFRSLGIGSLYQKWLLILNELKTLA